MKSKFKNEKIEKEKPSTPRTPKGKDKIIGEVYYHKKNNYFSFSPDKSNEKSNNEVIGKENAGAPSTEKKRLVNLEETVHVLGMDLKLNSEEYWRLFNKPLDLTKIQELELPVKNEELMKRYRFDPDDDPFFNFIFCKKTKKYVFCGEDNKIFVLNKEMEEEKVIQSIHPKGFVQFLELKDGRLLIYKEADKYPLKIWNIENSCTQSEKESKEFDEYIYDIMQLRSGILILLFGSYKFCFLDPSTLETMGETSEKFDFLECEDNVLFEIVEEPEDSKEYSNLVFKELIFEDGKFSEVKGLGKMKIPSYSTPELYCGNHRLLARKDDAIIVIDTFNFQVVHTLCYDNIKFSYQFLKFDDHTYIIGTAGSERIPSSILFLNEDFEEAGIISHFMNHSICEIIKIGEDEILVYGSNECFRRLKLNF